MPEYLMSGDHRSPPAHVMENGLRHPVAPLIRREDIHRLSQLGLLRHTDGWRQRQRLARFAARYGIFINSALEKVRS